MSKQRAKGTTFETSIVRHLQQNGFPHAERRALHGGHDKGDITGTPGLVWECKNHKQHRLNEWLNETETERTNANAELGILIVKRAGTTNPDQQYAVITVETLLKLLQQAGWTPT